MCKSYTYDAILFILKEGNSVIYNNIDKPRGHYTMWNKPTTEDEILHDSTYMSSLK
jgi:hypothetical protein